MLQVLEQQKITAAADAEATYLENQMLGESDKPLAYVPPKEEINAFDRTMHYLEGLLNHVKPLSPDAKPYVPVVS